MTANLPSREDLAEVAFLYYIRNMNQQEIASYLGVSRPVVSRLLATAREQGVVTFFIDFPLQRRADLEIEIMQAWPQTKLKTVIVVEGGTDNQGLGGTDPSLSPGFLSVAQAGASWLEKQVRPGVQIGLSWGSTAQTVIELVRFERRIDATVVQLSGEVSFEGVQPGYELVRKLAEKMGANFQYMSVPASAPTKEIARILVETTNLRDSLKRAADCDVALLGIGAFGSGSTDRFLTIANASKQELKEAEQSGVVGQISSRLFTAAGLEAEGSLNSRLFSVSLDQIREIPEVALVASGAEKARAVAGALNGGLGSALIVDVPLAEKILKG